MNAISKELRHQIAVKVSNALNGKDEDFLEKSKLKYRGRIDKLSKLWSEFEQERENLKTELRSVSLDLAGYEGKYEIRSVYRHNVDEDEIVSKIIVQLQYSKEPDFLSSIDALIQKEVPQKITR